MSVILLLHTILMALTFGNFELLTVDYNSIDTPIVELNNHTLREVFEGGNLVVNGDFNTTGSWTSDTNTFTISGGQITLSNGNGSQTFVRLISLTVDETINDNIKIYQVVKYKINDNLALSVSISRPFETTIRTSPVQNTWYIDSKVSLSGTNYTEPFRLQIYYANTTNQKLSNVNVDFAYTINMEYFGISSLTVGQMDSYFNEYQNNIGADDVTYTINEHDMTDLIILLGFGFSWVGIFWILRKVIS